jgi:hypothetical protein
VKIIVDIMPREGLEKTKSPAETRTVCDDMVVLLELSKWGPDNVIEAYPVPFDYMDVMSDIQELKDKIDGITGAADDVSSGLSEAESMASDLVRKFEDA